MSAATLLGGRGFPFQATTKRAPLLVHAAVFVNGGMVGSLLMFTQIYEHNQAVKQEAEMAKKLKATKKQ